MDPSDEYATERVVYGGAIERLEARLAEAERETREAEAAAAAQAQRAREAEARLAEAERARDVCPDCHNVFLQPFRCTTCGAQKLYDATLRNSEAREKALREALEKIVAWDLPDVPRDGKMVSYSSEYGSRGEREYIRNVARAALAGKGE